MIYTLPHARNVISMTALVILRVIPLFTIYEHAVTLYYCCCYRTKTPKQQTRAQILNLTCLHGPSSTRGGMAATTRN